MQNLYEINNKIQSKTVQLQPFGEITYSVELYLRAGAGEKYWRKGLFVKRLERYILT